MTRVDLRVGAGGKGVGRERSTIKGNSRGEDIGEVEA